ncbi:MAG TPA: hypothetical protein PKC30_03320 [Saprospiraceae bacterium]|nr:hypothetical protein [Saprospiraceae bacterium]
MMQRVSSNFTIFLKIFIPTAWITFFGLFTIAIWISEDANLPLGGGEGFRWIFTGCFIFLLACMYFSIMQLKRVEFAKDGIYVTNYFKTYRYAYHDVVNIYENNLAIATLAIIQLRNKGKFGRRIPFIISKVNYIDFITQNPELFDHIMQKDDQVNNI